MRRSRLFLVAILCFTATGYAQNYSYLFVWSGDDAKKDADFLAVIDADPKSPHYGQAVASVAVPGPSGTPHHTELDMPHGRQVLAARFPRGRVCARNSLFIILRATENRCGSALTA
jgi:56kDa selenium binding protein (SBP56)